jgi:general L-amino acid transport system permease protein
MSMTSLLGFLRSCFATPLDALLSVAIIAALALIVPDFIRWALIDAVWRGGSGQDCAGIDGACWLFIRQRLDQILYGGYPVAERWRVVVPAAMGLLALVVLMLPRVRRKMMLAVFLLAAYAPVTAILLRGGVFGLSPVPTAEWGGLMLTITIAAWTIASAVPLGLVLALGRRSRLPVVATASAGYIEIMRGLPLVGILFVAIVLFPLFVPPGVEIDKLLRALIAFTLFNAANLAEVFRGGLQSVPSHQREAGTAIGLRPWQTGILVVIPQAVANALPGIVNVCVSIVKETTIVLIVGLFDVLGILQAGISDPAWLVGDQVRTTAYFFAGAVFWTICFSLSRYSARIERAMNAGRRR